MKWIFIPLSLFILAYAKPVSAELFHETVSNIQIPTDVTWGTQITWQGHIIYDVKDLGQTYQVKIARDGEPHQYPYFYVSFNKNWDYMGTTRHVNPEAERKAAEEKKKTEEAAKKKAEEDARRAQEEQERLRREQEEINKPKPEPPVVKPPEEEEPEEPDPDPTPTPGPDPEPTPPPPQE